ncbi:MAG: diguanylate cyclase [Kiritimatiellales bacterium]|nr:diguanylate cyclase [Kiritimatiellota bacterium]MBL7012416.1 diguanylate cyclase [Kiritimatiellales bacterium]
MNEPDPKTILIVDDMRTNALALASILKAEWTVKTTQDGKAALQIAEEDPMPDLILLDINMPGMDGYEVCRHLKESEKTRDIPVIFVTAKDDQKDEAFGLGLGAVDYIIKPVNKTIVKARIRNHLALRQALTELALNNEELERLATRDKLTGLYNRRRLDQLMAAEIERAWRYGRPLSIMLLDIDKFKTINDTLGHLVGDTILSETAKQLQNSVRSCDLVGRWGGDEFIIICPETTPDTALPLAERLCRDYAACEFTAVDGLTASFGVASYREGRRADDLFSSADDALYRAKRNGRNQVAQEVL